MTLPPRSECLGFPPRHVCAAERCLLLTYLLTDTAMSKLRGWCELEKSVRAESLGPGRPMSVSCYLCSHCSHNAAIKATTSSAAE